MNKIKAVILDVDGVIVGDKQGYNSPYPPKEVVDKLKQIRQKGIYIILCSAKPYRSVKKIVDDAKLFNLQTALAGAISVDPLSSKVINKHIIKNKITAELTKKFIENNIYTEVYTTTKYYIQENQKNNITQLHSFTLSFEPTIVDNLISQIYKSEIIKVLPIAYTSQGKKIVEQIFLNYKEKLVLGWGTHPAVPNYFFGNITAKGISKKQSALEIIDLYKIKRQEILGVGDSLTDWDFIGICGFAGAVGNAAPELKKLVLSKGDYGYVGKSVDENGILDIFDHFEL